MREIKFRGKRKDNGEWCFGSLEIWSKKDMIILCPKDKKQSLHDVTPKTVGQFTGLTDKNGKEIFEGDILIVDDSDSIDRWVRGEKGVVEFIPARFSFVFCNNEKKMLTNEFEDCVEIIGNIHDNPELLTKR